MNVGDYVRIHGYIDKITNINEFREPSMKYALEQPSWNDDIIFIGEEDIDKSSSNIIDLIEVGDYVNGYRVAEIETLPTKQKLVVVGYGYDADEISENNIKSIVTKECFESMEYKVGD